jgi:S-DNA-T family DNA segregation ATPase FtsK/SpoIIIE
VTKSEPAIKMLKRAVNHMEERYEILKKQKVKNLKEYNEKFPNDQMYRIVIVIDELADLMMSSSSNKKETETAITRIAQKARAV